MKIKFKRDTAFRKQFFVPESFAHPAKMDAQLLIWLVEHYTEAGDTILDPMAGMGTTMLACTLGRNVVLVELEEKFCKMMRDNWGQVKMRPQLGSAMGDCKIIRGDARNLEEVLNVLQIQAIHSDDKGTLGDAHKRLGGKRTRENTSKSGNSNSLGCVDKIVTSPPFGQQNVEGTSDWMTREKAKGKLRSGTKGKILEHDNRSGRQLPDNPNNIGNLPYGEIDKCIFSPPYAETGVGDWQTGRAEFQAWVLNELATKGYIEWQGKRYTESEWRAMNHGRIDGRTTKGVHKHPTDGYSKDPNNLGNLPYGQINKIVTSPPYSEGTGHKRGDNADTELLETKGIYLKGQDAYSNNKDNIGNLKNDSYLEAMLQVYQQCYKVLKPQGLMILVTKNFIRNKQVVRLDEDTIKLCEQAGFNFVERHYRKLPSLSFWRVTYAKKYPDLKHLIKQLWYEDILVFKK